ncbi:MAG TPA: hypothetical protein PKJ95_06555 [Atribacterota bacterium]|nr:hypothetical protein [Atribacterota bacterium]
MLISDSKSSKDYQFSTMPNYSKKKTFLPDVLKRNIYQSRNHIDEIAEIGEQLLI